MIIFILLSRGIPLTGAITGDGTHPGIGTAGMIHTGHGTGVHPGVGVPAGVLRGDGDHPGVGARHGVLHGAGDRPGDHRGVTDLTIPVIKEPVIPAMLPQTVILQVT